VTGVLLACVAGMAFGALTVAIRIALRRAPDPEVAPAITSTLACALAATAAAVAGDLGDVDLDALWPFAAIGAGVPGLSQIVFVRAIRDAGPARAAVVLGVAPLLSAVLAVAFLDESLSPALALGTVLVVAGGAALAWERSRPVDFRLVGLAFALAAAGLFAVRDNLVRAVARSEDVPPLAATTASLLGASCALVVLVLVVRRREAFRAMADAAVPFLPSAAILAIAYAALLEAFDRGTVTVVAPLNATQSLWAVAFAAIFLGRSEAIGRRLVLAAVLIVAGSAIVAASR
jgi:drug/metabolite transporter (DMT)-like permease